MVCIAGDNSGLRPSDPLNRRPEAGIESAERDADAANVTMRDGSGESPPAASLAFTSRDVDEGLAAALRNWPERRGHPETSAR
jgi:hypothetical protein